MSSHASRSTANRTSCLGIKAHFEATLFDKEELIALVEGAGFELTSATVRAPYEFESQTPRLYVAATRID